MERLAFLDEELDIVEATGLRRRLRLLRGSQSPRVVVDGREVILLCSNNYLGLAEHPRLKCAAKDAIDKHGCSASGSRLISGNTELHALLETKLALFMGTEAALLYNSGYMANVGLLSSLLGQGDVIFSDELNHASIVDGCRLGRAEVRVFSHCDMAALEEQLRAAGSYRRRMVVTDGVFSMDGDLAPLPQITELARKYSCLVAVDETHAVGLFGSLGRGVVEHFGLEDSIDVRVGTLGKALGGFGAFVAGSQRLKDFLINKSRSFIFTAGLPPAVLAAAHAALDIVSAGHELREVLWKNVAYFKGELVRLGFDTMRTESQIIPLLIGEPDLTMRMSEMLLEEGVFIQGIRPPSVPIGRARLRATIMASHTSEDLAEALETMAKVGRRLKIVP